MDTSHYDKCRTMMITHQNHAKIRNYAMMFLVFLSIVTTAVPMAGVYGVAGATGFMFGILGCLYNIGVLILTMFAIPTRPKVCAGAMASVLIGMLMTCIFWILGIPMLIVIGTLIPECRQSAWLQKQEGYPHFNERFSEQMQHFGKEYEPDHQLDNLREAEMPDIPEIPDEIPENSEN